MKTASTLFLTGILLASAGRLSAQAPINDGFSNTILLNEPAGNTSANNTNATWETDEPAEFLESAGYSLWWRWVAPADGRYAFHTLGSSFDTMLGIYTGTALADLELTAFNDDSAGTRQSRVSFEATQGTTYYIIVDGYGAGDHGKIKLSWLLQPTLVYTWREDFRSEGYDAYYDDDLGDWISGWYPKTTAVTTGLVIRGRSSNTFLPVYGYEINPVALVFFWTEKVGKKNVRHFEILQSKPHMIEPADPENEDPYLSNGGFASGLVQYKQRPISVFEESQIGIVVDDEAGGENWLYSIWGLAGKASLKAPYAGAPKTWFASLLQDMMEYSVPAMDASYTPEQGEPEWGMLNKLTSKLLFSSSYTNRVKGMDFDAAVAAIRQHLLSTGAVEYVAE